MIVSCPACDKDLVVAATVKPPAELQCKRCSAKARISVKIDLIQRGQASPSTTLPSPNPKLVLVAVEGEVTNEMITEILSEGGFEVVSTHSGDETFRQMCERRPVVSVIDVGIPKIFESGVLKTETEEGLEDGLKDLKIILLSSIHNTTRYKREPEALYGASDYIERHHIEDGLLSKVMNLVKGSQGDYVSLVEEAAPVAQSPPDPPPVKTTPVDKVSVEPAVMEPPAVQPPSVEPAAVVPPPVETAHLESPPLEQPPVTAPAAPRPSGKQEGSKGDLSSHDMAKRLARLIISDIALYNQKRIQEGIRNGTIREVLKDELEEGHKLYRSRIPSELYDGTNYYEEAISDFIRKQKDKIKG